MVRKQQKPVSAKIQLDHPFFGIIGDAYRVFAYPKPSSIEVCVGCCMEADIEADFFNPPIDELPLRYIQDWFFAAYDPNGVAKATWAYLLPRILEILALDEDVANVGLEVSLNRFATGDSGNWTSEEWQILDRFQRCYLNREIAREGEPLDDTICMFALAGWPLDSLFEQVADQPDDVLIPRLWNDWCRGRVPGRDSIWITAFWGSPEKTQVYEFYTSEVLYNRAAALALADETSPDLAQKALEVAQVIEASIR